MSKKTVTPDSQKIPDWFSPEKYQSKQNKKNWAYEIGIRYPLIENGKFKTSQAYKDFFEIVILSKDNWTIKGANSDKDEPINVSTIGTIIDFYDEYRKTIGGLHKQCDNPSYDREVIFINLEATNEEIFKAFKKYLAAQRKQKNEVKALRQPIHNQIDKWNELQLLACFDLFYWRAAFNTKLTYGAIAKAVNPSSDFNEVNPDDQYRRTILNHITEVFSESVARRTSIEAENN